MNKKILLTMLLGLFMISFSSAYECWDTAKLNTNISLLQKCEACSFVNITSITYNGTKTTIKTTLAPSESNFTITEVGIFTDSGIISHCNTNIEKNASTQYIVTYTLEVI